jgi:hypothetical protein
MKAEVHFVSRSGGYVIETGEGENLKSAFVAAVEKLSGERERRTIADGGEVTVEKRQFKGMMMPLAIYVDEPVSESLALTVKGEQIRLTVIERKDG